MLQRARPHSPTSAIDPRPEHTGEPIVSRRCAAFHDAACTLRCSGDAKPHRPFRSRSAPCETRKPTLVPDLDIRVTGSGPGTLECDGETPEPAQAHREHAARTDEPEETSQDAFRCTRSVRFYSKQELAGSAGSRPPRTRLLSPGDGRESLTDQRHSLGVSRPALPVSNEQSNP